MPLNKTKLIQTGENRKKGLSEKFCLPYIAIVNMNRCTVSLMYVTLCQTKYNHP